MNRDVIADGFFDGVLQLLVEYLALLHGQLALFDQIAQDAFGFFLCDGGGADAGQNELADAFTQLIHGNNAPFHWCISICAAGMRHWDNSLLFAKNPA